MSGGHTSCSLDIHSEQDAFPYGNTALTHYQIVFLQNRDAPVDS
ncbi:MAG: hypothetical protein AAF630_00965 [Cyanobacteria bacterium P01_C01_bin.38]